MNDTTALLVHLEEMKLIGEEAVKFALILVMQPSRLHGTIALRPLPSSFCAKACLSNAE